VAGAVLSEAQKAQCGARIALEPRGLRADSCKALSVRAAC
jgi:hypothetical protein